MRRRDTLDSKIQYWRRQVSMNPEDDRAIIQLASLLMRSDEEFAEIPDSPQKDHEYFKTLVLSTAHIEQWEDESMENLYHEINDMGEDIIALERPEYPFDGFHDKIVLNIHRFGDEEQQAYLEQHFPNIARIFEYAAAYGYDVVHIASWGGAIQDLPQFNW